MSCLPYAINPRDANPYGRRRPPPAPLMRQRHAPPGMAIRASTRRTISRTSLTGYLLGLLLMISLPCPAATGQLEPYQGLGQTPALSLEDLGHKVHTLADSRGRVVLVNFWASWCGPCVMEMPSLQRLSEAMASKPFTLLAVNEQEASGTVWKFADRFGLHFPLLLDRDGQTAFNWGIDIYPTSFLVDPQGRIRYVAYGPRNWDAPEMIQAIEGLLGSSRTDNPQAK
jgi:thiol-disulfide isomerase/thioredoxin